jgi:putative tricarboxylic transport membrane protein
MEVRSPGELKRDIVAGIGLLALALAYFIGAQRIPGSSLIGKGIGAGAVPTALAVALAFFSTILILRSLLGLRRLARAGMPSAPRLPLAQSLRPHVRAFGMLVIGIGFISLLSELGYVVSVALLLAATAWYNGQKNLKALLLFAIGAAIAYDLLFVQLLGIALPPGIWPTLFAPLLGTDG